MKYPNFTLILALASENQQKDVVLHQTPYKLTFKKVKPEDINPRIERDCIYDKI